MAMLEVQNLTKTYKGQSSPAIENVSLQINEGEIMAFLGPNGAGKSTALKCITGIHPYDSGSVTVCGCDLKKDPIGAKMNIGYVSDDHATYENLTGSDYLNFVCNVYRVPLKERKSRIEELARQLELEAALDKQINGYSHGMKQKLAIIAAFIHSPELIIMDEPFVGLDPKAAHILKQMMRKHCDEGGAIFFSTHVLEVAEKLCDKVAIIKQGKLVASGTMEEVKGDESLESVFLELDEEK